MRLLALIVASFVPGLLWVWFFYRQDRYDKEPVYLVIITFVAGMLAVFPALMIELPFKAHLTQPTHLLVRFLVALLVVGLGEESLKLLAVVVTAFRHRAFNEPVDGIIYAVSASLGFAALENLLYVLTFGFEVAPVRAVIATLAHASFGGVAGLYLGLAHRSPRVGWKLALTGLGIAALLHGVYDFLLIARWTHPIVAILLVYFSYRFVTAKIRELQRRRPLR
ncbi:MAG TPA: PrsW family glutamic-type intramembrane protease [Limnochordia bacterium]|nr:PrsW family glutamic-type intramembrane protease [Limnochordia bacterium]